MTPLARILGSQATSIGIGVLVALNHILLGVLAWQGSKLSLVMLVVFSLAWVVLAVSNGMARRSNLEHWEQTLDSLHEQSELCSDYASLLGEACGALSTWDREEAADIVSRAKTIGRLRQANFDERMGND